MPLLFVDLDNTVVDRSAAVHRWAHEYVAARRGQPDRELAEAVFAADGNGTRPKAEVADDLEKLLGLSGDEKESIIQVLRAGVLRHLEADPAVEAALHTARRAGWVPFVVSNGNVTQQNSKVENLGLGDLIEGMVVSEGVGVAKPDPGIFEIAAREAGGSLEGAWMIGDTPEADIAGAQAAGIRSAWVSHGTLWPEELERPDIVARTFPEAVTLIIRQQGEATS